MPGTRLGGRRTLFLFTHSGRRALQPVYEGAHLGPLVVRPLSRLGNLPHYQQEEIMLDYLMTLFATIVLVVGLPGLMVWCLRDLLKS